MGLFNSGSRLGEARPGFERQSALTLEQLLPYSNVPGLGVRELKGKLAKAVAKIRKTVKALVKNTERSVTMTARRQYFLTVALRDLRTASKRNEDIVIAGMAGVFILAYGIAITTMEFLILSFGATFNFADSTGIDSILLTLTAGGVLLALAVLLVASLMNYMSIAVMDGVNRKVHRSIRSTMRRSLSNASRTASAWCLLGAVHVARLLAVMALAYVYIKWGLDAFALPMEVLAAVGTGAVLWLIMGLIQYSLIPYVALFEPQLLLSQTFARSRRLVKKQGWPFLITTGSVLAIFLTALYKISEPITQTLGLGINLLFYAGALTALIYANGAMVMLYAKRKRARV